LPAVDQTTHGPAGGKNAGYYETYLETSLPVPRSMPDLARTPNGSI
jgi:hypothetical protein